MIKIKLVVFLLLLLFCQGQLCPANTSNEFFVYSGIGLSIRDVDYLNRFNAYHDTGWSGEQDIQYKNALRYGIGGGFVHWFSPHWGIQVFGHYQPTLLDFKSESVHIQYTYASWSPILPFPEIEVDETFNSPEPPSGTYKQLCLGMNFALRFDVPPLRLSLSGGPCLYRIFDGELADLYFQNSMQISRGGIITSKGLVTAEMDSRTRLGANLGMRAQIPLSTVLHLFLDCRYFYCPKTDIKLNFTGVEEIYFFHHANTPGEIEPLLELKSIQLEPSFFCLCVGLSIIVSGSQRP
jgi:hypothetical protein